MKLDRSQSWLSPALESMVVIVAMIAAAGCASSPRSAPTTPGVAAPSTTTTSAVSRAPALHCPPRPPAVVPPHQVPGTAALFVPGHPVELLACRYHGLNQPQRVGTLAGSARLDPTPIAVALNAATVVPNKAAFNCPADFAETILLLFGYADGTALTASVAAAGCRFAHNGDIVVSTSAATLAALEEKVGHDRPA
ncbi:MAG TPA: hypothetical protein VN636_06005 [Acidimicrobiia bacterium]|nr:hypothetical protein [Acidimicrobiia bacterium]